MSAAKQFCFGPYTISAVTIPAVTIPAVTMPATTLAGTVYPAHTYPAQSYPAQTIPGRTIPRSCITIDPSLLAATSVRISGYGAIDQNFDATATNTYWSSAGAAATLPDFSAPGFGELNAAGFPKNQYVRPYVRRDGTVVSGYWRNSPTDGLPTCRIIHC